jgi:hypothetical protein
MFCSVILSEAKNLSSIYLEENKQREILRFAQNDSVLSFSRSLLSLFSFEFRRQTPKAKRKRAETSSNSTFKS